MKKITWNNLHEATQHEIRVTHGIGYGREADKKLEQAVRHHLDGANVSERREIYEKFYGKKNK